MTCLRLAFYSAVLLVSLVACQPGEPGAKTLKAAAGIQPVTENHQNNMRSIKKLHKAVYEPIADLTTWRAMPTGSIRHIDPFLFLNHHGPQQYGPNNNGLPFGPHPHRGFETLTYILQGDIMHKDSMTGESIIKTGGIQWMTAGSGLIHAEVSSEEFKREGGMEEVIQIWLNLPSHLKMTAPSYIGLQKDKVPAISLDEDRVTVHLISGEWDGQKAPITALTGLTTTWIDFKKGATLRTKVDPKRNILFYMVNGDLDVNGTPVTTHQLVEFANNGDDIEVKALSDATIIYCHGEPFNEPIVAHGPFVMNSEEEIRQAIRDYQMGKLGSLRDSTID